MIEALIIILILIVDIILSKVASMEDRKRELEDIRKLLEREDK